MPETCVHTPAVHAGQTLFVSGESSMPRADTPIAEFSESWKASSSHEAHEVPLGCIRGPGSCIVRQRAEQTLFVLGESSVPRADTPEQPTKEDEKARTWRGRMCAHGRRGYRCKLCPPANAVRDKSISKAQPLNENEAYRGAPAVLALGPHSVVLADGGAPAVLAPAPLSVVLARAKARKTAKDNAYRKKNRMWRGRMCAHGRRGYRCILCHPAFAWKKKNKDYLKAYAQKNNEYLKAYWKAYKQQTRGCVDCKEWPDCYVGIPRYDGRCFRCFKRKFPFHEKAQSKARVEWVVRDYIERNFPHFVHDHTMHTGHCDCTVRRRVDHRRQVGNTLLCVETDEMHHRYYDKDDEQARYHDIMMEWGGKLVFIRFNPDRDSLGPKLNKRLERLQAEITRHLGRIEREENTELLEKYYLYYPEGTPDVH